MAEIQCKKTPTIKAVLFFNANIALINSAGKISSP